MASRVCARCPVPFLRRQTICCLDAAHDGKLVDGGNGCPRAHCPLCKSLLGIRNTALTRGAAQALLDRAVVLCDPACSIAQHKAASGLLVPMAGRVQGLARPRGRAWRRSCSHARQRTHECSRASGATATATEASTRKLERRAACVQNVGRFADRDVPCACVCARAHACSGVRRCTSGS